MDSVNKIGTASASNPLTIRPSVLAAVLLATAIMAGSSPVGAASRDETASAPPPDLYRQLMECRNLADSTARLTCFDRQSAVLDEATRKHEIVISDRQAVERAKRGLFGFATPVAKLMGFGGNVDESEEIGEVTTTVESARRGSNGWIITFADGSIWEQNDTRDFVLSPKPGNEARIKRGALGTFLVSVRGQTSLKMRRVQ